MKILGAGLSRTGTTSLTAALKALGYHCIHYDTQRLNAVLDGGVETPDFHIYDDVDAVTDLPAACFYEELLAAYPDSKCILTVRDEAAWWKSVEAHFNRVTPVASRADDPFRWDLRTFTYGSATARQFTYRKRYREHNERVCARVAADRLLVMDITAGDGWERLCPFLGVDVPSVPFPHSNRGVINVRRREAVEAIEALAPEGSCLIVVSDGWFRGDEIPGRRLLPFLERHGQYWGAPADDVAAIAELERMRDAGARAIVFLWTTFWWLQHYRGFAEHLDQHFPRLVSNDAVVAYALQRATA